MLYIKKMNQKKKKTQLELDKKERSQPRGGLSNVEGGWSLNCGNVKGFLGKKSRYGFKVACVSTT